MEQRHEGNTETMSVNNRRIAVVGAGIAGLACAWALSRRHKVTIFEQNEYLGGHSNTVDIDVDGKSIPVDTGFIVFNPPNYPYLVALFDHLNVDTVATDMSFGVSMRGGQLEYAGSDLNGLFAQRRNLMKPRFWRMLNDIRRFYRSAPQYLKTANGESIGELLATRGYSDPFVEDHLLPMAAAIWSASRRNIEKYPADAFIRFFANHGLLELRERPRWHTVKGGSREYVRRLIADTESLQIVKRAAKNVERNANGVVITDEDGERQPFDEVVLACHGDEALALLAHPNAAERRILSAFRYSDNEAVLHSDPTLMPQRRAAWSSWNYIQPVAATAEDNAYHERPLCVSYWMNQLQALPTHRDIIVTLNPVAEPAQNQVFRRFQYSHPIFDEYTRAAQIDSIDIQGTSRAWFCGSYFGHGFHEDGIESGLWVAAQLGCAPNWQLAMHHPRLPHSYRVAAKRAA